ncbi:LacI family DNA-binding transcriptional regulator [Anaerosporobacter faecicola]|uniref:LacI family DNA-binding transcriptional regulator n=1 Tax=Anaerosporobacter faecicola TaxID=2718714 RepID=UPI001439DCCE|nr:LacI family DNA-binding transcriptional regulator [Anaerosporobacter faecicola]
MSKDNISIYTIAKEAGVSPSTVSRVMTNSTRVSEEKTQKVKEIIEKYDFRPNALARSLSNTKTKMIGALVGDIRNPFFAALATECEKAATKEGYMLLLSNFNLDGKSDEADKLFKLYEQRVDAIIQIGGAVDDVVSNPEYVDAINRIANDIPVIISGKLDGADCCQVNLDEGKSLEVMFDYLVSIGHKEIALIGGESTAKSTYDKRTRYKQLIARYGLTYREEYIANCSYDINGGYHAMKKFLKEVKKLPSAIIGINDFASIGIMQALQETGYRIPEDISVCGFDNTIGTEACMPKLTTVGYDYEDFANKLVMAAIKRIQGEDVPRLQMVKSELVIKNSCEKI